MRLPGTDSSLGQTFQENKISKILNFEFCRGLKSVAG